MKKRFLSFMIALFMVIQMVPLQASGDNGYLYNRTDLPETIPPYPAQGQTYWIIFNEGFRDNRLEMSTFNVTGDASGVRIIWNGGLKATCSNGSVSRSNQFVYTPQAWVTIGDYGVLSDKATKVFASNVDVYDSNGNIVFHKSDWVDDGNNVPDDAAFFNGHYYMLYNDASSFDAAQQNCVARGGHLATLTTSSENSFCYNYIVSKNVKSAYFGFTDAEKEGVWKWITGETTSYTNWHSGEPNGENSREDYAMFYYKFTDGTWNDGDFGGSTVNGGTYYICEWDGNSTPSECTGYHDWRIDAENIGFVCAKCGKHQGVSPVLGFEYGKDNFSFSNADVTSYDISYTGFSYMTPALKLDIMSLLANGINRFVNYVTSGSAYKGACFGIAAMGASFFSGMEPNDFGADNPSGLCIAHANSFLPNLDTKLKDAINIMFLSQSSTGVAFFQQIQDGSMFGDNNFKDIVTVAKDLKHGDYPAIVAFNIPIGGHAVNIIGIEPDDFMEENYCITAYDSNRPNFPSYFLVSKDYSKVKFCCYSPESGVTAYNVSAIYYFIKSPSFSIDYFAPGLRTSPLYLSTRRPKAMCHDSSEAKVLGSGESDGSDEIITFIVPNECNTAIVSPSGKAVTFSGASFSTELPLAKVVPFTGTTLSKIILPYEQGLYNISLDQAFYININHRQNAATLYSESGCDITYSADGILDFVPKEKNKYAEAAYYKYDILDGSDSIGFELRGIVSNSLSLNCQNGIIELYGEDISRQTLFIQHNDDLLTKEALSESIGDNDDKATVYVSEDGICLSSENSAFTPCNGSDDCPGKVFTDMPAKKNWAHDPIDWAIVNNVTAGTSESTFSPNDTCTRAQIVTFLWRAAGSPEPENTNNPFTDITSKKFYYKAVLWAAENGITSGTSETTFSPDDSCTRGQVVTFLWRFAGSPKPETTSNPFTDVKAGKYYSKAVLWAAENGITSGTSKTTFSPDETCTRAQIVTFLYRYMVG